MAGRRVSDWVRRARRPRSTNNAIRASWGVMGPTGGWPSRIVVLVLVATTAGKGQQPAEARAEHGAEVGVQPADYSP